MSKIETQTKKMKCHEKSNDQANTQRTLGRWGSYAQIYHLNDVKQVAHLDFTSANLWILLKDFPLIPDLMALHLTPL